ncbi:MAG: N-acetyltransferase YodP [Planctomycetes bacterium ADurb.Bin401]|nr:MAG: N-acetyltransferase YodP [Planctomycetes bacterium ADurb.Bin401]
MTPDTIETFHGQTIQHGKYNNRIYLMKFNSNNNGKLPFKLIELAEKKQYSKIFAKVHHEYIEEFLNLGFLCEAIIPCFYNGRQTACLLSYYMDSARRKSATPKENEKVIEACRKKQQAANHAAELPPSMTLRRGTPEDASAMAILYRHVFKSYPFPIDDPEYIRRTMKTYVDYFGIWQADKLAALSSAEIDAGLGNAEMTDFATSPESRGKSLALILLKHMEEALRKKNIKTFYTIARAASFGINITFAKQGYTFSGRLIQNTQIDGRFEDMNVWYKTI